MDMKMNFKISGYAAAFALAALLTLSCRYDPLDSYSRIPPDRTEEEEDDKGGMNGAFASGFGTAESPYIIADAKHIANIPKALYQGEMVYFKLSADIDMKDVAWTPLNSASPFSLFIDFDGDGHIIRNFSCKGQSYSSFFGVLCGECRNVGFIDADVSGSNATGIITGYLGIASPTSTNFVGTIRNCYVAGSVSGNPAGGMVGKIGTAYSPYYCEVADSYSAADVSSTGSCGGIAGELLAGGAVSGCYASGDVSGGGYTGGIAGNLASSAYLKDVVAWNGSLSGADGKTGFVSGNGAAYDGACNWNRTVTTLANPDGKTSAQLRGIVTGWGSPWIGNGSEANGYPALDWLAARADIADICGQTEPEEPIEPEEITEGTGTAADPYLIGTAGQLFNLKSVLKAGETIYVKLTSDINLKKQNWTPLNNEGDFGLKIDFDGDGHTVRNLVSKNVRYAGFFGVLYGSCRNVKFTDAEIVSNSGSSAGVLGGYIGTGGKPAEVIGVEADGTVTNTAAGCPAGGLAGNVREAVIEDCTVNVKVVNPMSGSGVATGGIAGAVSDASVIRCCSCAAHLEGKDRTGGIVGFIKNGQTVTVGNCLFSGNLTGSQHVGGVVGELGSGSSVKNCFVTGSVDGWGCVGGIAGRAAGCGWNAASDGFYNSVDSCIVWLDDITVTRSDDKGASSGAVVGYTCIRNTLKDCRRKRGMTLTAAYCSELYDQENADSSVPLVTATPPDGYNYIYPYHGREAEADASASEVAKALNWDESVWDLSGATPSLNK